MQADRFKGSRSPWQVVCFCVLAVAVLATAQIAPGLDGRVAALALDERGGAASRGPSLALAALRWDAPTPIAEALQARYPKLALDTRTGRLHVAWEEAGVRVRYAYRDEGGWHVSPNAWSGYSPSISLDADGQPHVVYAAELGTPSRSQILHRSARQDWVPSNVSDTSGNSQRPQISLLVGAQAHVAWVETLDGVDRIYHAVSRDLGATWLEMSFVANGAAPSLDASEGRVWLAWQGAPQSQPTSLQGDQASDIYAAQWLAEAPTALLATGGTWTAAVNVSQTLDRHSRAPDIAGGLAGQAHVVWEELAGDGLWSAVRYARYDATAWAESQPLSSGEGFVSAPQVVQSGQGMVTVAWDAGTRLLMRQASTGAWSNSEEIAANPAGIGDLALVGLSDGRLLAVWAARSEGISGAVWSLYTSQQRASATATLPPTATSTSTATSTTTNTATQTPQPTLTPTSALNTPTRQPTPTATRTNGGGETLTATPTITMSLMPTMTTTPTETSTPIATQTPTRVPTLPTPMVTASATRVLQRWSFLPVMIKDPGSGDNPIPVSGERLPDPNSPDAGGAVELKPWAELAPGGWEWSTASNLSSPQAPGAGHDARGAALALGRDGTLYAVWTAMLSGYPVLHYSLGRDGVWSAPTSFYMGEEPDLTVLPNGEVHLVFSGDLGGSYDVYHTVWEGDGWSWPDNVSQTSGNSTQPAVACSAQGQLVAVWTDNTEGVTRIYYGWRQGELWNTYFVPASTRGSAPDIAAGTSDRLWVCWQVQEPSGFYDVYASYGDGQNWSPFAINVSDSAGGDSLAPTLAGASGWGAYMAWQEGTTGSVIQFADTLEQSIWWALPTTLSAPGATRPALVSQSGGAACTLFLAWDAGDSLTLQRHEVGSAVWSPELLAGGSTGADVGTAVLVAGQPWGLHAAWLQTGPLAAGGSHDVYYRLGRPQLARRLWSAVVFKP
jgi:hypothetical protein